MSNKLNTASGVDYDVLDEAKRIALEAAADTDSNAGNRFERWTRNQSVQLTNEEDFYLASLVEQLGTKDLAADEMDDLAPETPSYYHDIGQCNAATVLNDLASVGAQPRLFHLLVAVEDERQWFTNLRRWKALVNGTAIACDKAGCVYAGGETAGLRNKIVPGAAVLGGSASGIIRPKDRLIMPRIEAGDRIILVASQGPHANGYTTIRQLAKRLPNGWNTQLPDETTFGDAVLAPTPIYVRMIQWLLDLGIRINYCSPITGHGWRKIMRADMPFGYVIDQLPEQQKIFGFLQDQLGYTNEQMYGSYNMGAGLALIVPAVQVDYALNLIHPHFPAHDAGFVTNSDRKFVDIQPVKVRFD